MRMLEVPNPEDIDMQDLLIFLTIKIKLFLVEAPETFFNAKKYILRYSSFKHIYICY